MTSPKQPNRPAAPAVCGQSMQPSPALGDELAAWSLDLGVVEVQLEELLDGSRSAGVLVAGVVVFRAKGRRDNVTRDLEKFLKALKRATESVP